MCRIILTALVAAAVASICYGQEYPSMNCTAASVGYTYPLAPPISYYTCLDPTTPMAFDCPVGSGYISNSTLTGCVPWVLWECTSKAGPPACNSSQQMTKFPHVDPNLFWICQGINLPQAESCPQGSGFIGFGANNGCQPWSSWSSQCPY